MLLRIRYIIIPKERLFNNTKLIPSQPTKRIFCMKKVLIIGNPSSGHGTFKNSLTDMVTAFCADGYSVEVRVLLKPGDAREYTSTYGASYDRIVICGGDGTVNSVLNGIMELETRPEISIVPMGTTNDYAHSLDIPSSTQGAIIKAVNGTPFDIDLGLFGEQYFAYVAAFGVFSRVTYETPQEVKNVLGRTAYLLSGLKEFPLKTTHMRFTWPDGEEEGDYLLGLFTNSISVGGFHSLFNGAELDDGNLEVTLIKEPKNLADIQRIIEVLLEIKTLDEIPGNFITSISTPEITIESDNPVPWSLDGESGGSFNRVTIKNVHKAFTVIKG